MEKINSIDNDSAVPSNEQSTYKIRVDYWLKRLDHTLSHTQIGSRLIYVVDGALLALLYFSLNTFGTKPSTFFVIAVALPVLFLSLLNWLHARFILVQYAWYKGIDKKLMTLLSETEAENKWQGGWTSSTHRIYATVHYGIFFILLFVAIGIGCYGLEILAF